MEWFERRFVNKMANASSIPNRVHNTMQRRFVKSKQEFKKQFLEEKVTQEIKAGPSASNISGTLPGLGGGEGQKPNLWGFLGFEAGTAPVEKVLGDIESISYRKNGRIYSVRRGKSTLIGQRYRIKLPDFGQDLPWAPDVNWLDAVEQGVSGLENFVYAGKLKDSRSTAGLQTKKTLRSQSMKPVMGYFSKLREDFRKRILEE